MAGTFVWYELMTTDAAAACSFYAQVLGWTQAPSGMPGIDYTLVSAGPHQVAGVMPLPAEAAAAGAPPAWIGYVLVDDVDAAAAAVQAAGGQICHPPTDIPTVGRFSTVADPHGAVVCLFRGSDGDAPPDPAPGTPGTVGWHELMAGDLASAWEFYSRQFGWVKADAIDMGPMGTYQLFGAAGASDAMGGMMTRPPEMPVAAWAYYFNVPAIDAAVGRVNAGGGQVLNGPMQVPGGGWIVNAVDPQGAMFSLVAPGR